MEKQTRRVKLSTDILSRMFRQGNSVHFRVLKGFPPEVEILSMEPDFPMPNLILTVRGFFEEGADGEIFDIVCETITDSKVVSNTNV